MRKSIFIFICVFVISGCHEAEEGGPTLISEHQYFPLQPGNSWEYGLPQYPPQYLDSNKREIASKVFLGNFEYALMIHTTITSSNTYVDSAYYRVDVNGNVFARKNEKEKEFNVYRLNAPDGFTWSTYFPHFSVMGEISVSVLESLVLNETTFTQCKNYSYGVKDFFDEESYSTLAPGLGLIQSGYYFGGGPTVLKKAIINGQEYNF